MSIPASDAPNARRSAPDVAVLIASQLSQGQDIQDIEPVKPEAGRLPDSEPTADSITVATNNTSIDIQGKHASIDETLDQRLIDLFIITNLDANAANLRVNTVNALRNEHEELKQEKVAMRSRLAKAEEDIDAAIQSIQLNFDSKGKITLEQIKIVEANLPRLEVLIKKRNIRETECEEQQAKWLKHNADVKEFEKNVRATW